MSSTPLDLLAALNAGHPSEITLEQLRHGELAPAQAATTRSHVDGCSRCQHLLEATFAEIPEADPVKLLAGIRQRLDQRPRSWFERLSQAAKRAAAPIALVATAAALLLVLGPTIEEPEHGTRLKGDAALHVFRHRDGVAVEALSGDTFAPGEPLRFKVDLPAEAQVFIVGNDPSGALYRVWPESGAQRFPAAVGIELPTTVSLDEAAGDEVFHLVSCPLTVAAPSCSATGVGKEPSCSKGCASTPFRLRRGE